MVRKLTREDIKSRNLRNQTSGLIVTKIEKDSPLINSLEINSIILEAQKKKIRNINDLNQETQYLVDEIEKWQM